MKDPVSARIRRAYDLPGAPPSADEPWAESLRRSIAQEDPTPPTELPSADAGAQMGRPPHQRSLRLGIAALAVALACGAVAGLALTRDDRPAQPLGADARVSLLERLEHPNPSPPPDPDGFFARSSIPAHVYRVRTVGDIQLFVGPAQPGSPDDRPSGEPDAPPRACLAAWRPTAAAASMNDPRGIAVCGPIWVGTGQVGFEFPEAPGDWRVPHVRFGIVPDDVVAVSTDDGRQVAVHDNIYALPLRTAIDSPLLTFIRRNGTRVTVAVRPTDPTPVAAPNGAP